MIEFLIEKKRFYLMTFHDLFTTGTAHAKHLVGHLDQILVKLLSPLLGLWSLGHDDSVAEFLGSSGPLGKSKIELRQYLTACFHNTGQNANAVPQELSIKRIGNVSFHHGGVYAK